MKEVEKKNVCLEILAGHWDLDHPILQSIEETSTRQSGGHGENDDGDNTDPISVMALAAGRLWCAIRDKIFVVCPNSLTVEVKLSSSSIFEKEKSRDLFSIHL